MVLDFEIKLNNEDISIYYDEYLTKLIQEMPKYKALSEEVKMALLPFGKNTFEFDDLTATAYVSWNADIETKSWGIKNISAYIKKVDVSVYFNVIGFLSIAGRDGEDVPDGDEIEFDGEILISSEKSPEVETFDVIVSDDDIANSGFYSIDDMDVDFKNRLLEFRTSTVR